MLKCKNCPKYYFQYELDCIEDDIFLHYYQMNHDGEYVIPNKSLRKIIYNHVYEVMIETDIESLVNGYGVFKAIKSYKDEYGVFNPTDDVTFMKTFGTLAFHILYKNIRDNNIIIEEHKNNEKEKNKLKKLVS
jgi:hypothetical protein